MSHPLRGRLCLTLGDPAGIGPELAARTVAGLPEGIQDRVILVGGRADFELACRLTGSGLDPQFVEPGGELPQRFCLLDISPGGPAAVPGRPDERSGRLAGAAIETGARLCLSGAAAALVTGPIGKAWLNRAGYRFRGHTEMLAALAGSDDPVMLLAGRRLRTAPLTTHVPLADVTRMITPRLIEATVRRVHAALKGLFGIASPRMLATGINPHCGDSGLAGLEDDRVVRPALERLRADGIAIDGPFSADTAFLVYRERGYHAAITASHDQAMLPIKLLEFGRAVNITLGLPFLRFSPDHGPAYDIAGTGTARIDSMARAVRLGLGKR